MKSFIIMYISIGIGYYIGMCIARHELMSNSTSLEKLRGTLGILVWPLMMIYHWNSRFSIFGGDLVSYIKRKERK